MRIAQVAPLYESVPPRLYGGTERVVSYLTEELVREGHEVTLFASGDSRTAARLVSVCPHALRLAGCVDSLAHHFLLLERVLRHAREFDVIHFHVDYLHFPMSRRLPVAHATTLHGRLDLPDLQPLYTAFADIPVVSISAAQRAPLPQAGWLATVHHGLPLDLHRFRATSDEYFAFVGRVSREKRVDRAIEIAKRTGTRLKIAAKIDRSDADYFESEMAPLMHHPLVEFVGELGERDKSELLGGARALLFPIDWPEPFGLVMIEALACGTPVVAFRHGSVPEIIDHGVTGYVVEDIDAAVSAATRVDELSRAACRETFERRFSAERMARDYLTVYTRLAARAERPDDDRLACEAAA